MKPTWNDARATLGEKVAELIRERDEARAALAARPVVESPEAQRLRDAWKNVDDFVRSQACDGWFAKKSAEFGSALRAFCESKPPAQPAPAEDDYTKAAVEKAYVDVPVKMAFKDWERRGESIYSTEEGIELSASDFHSGTVFEGSIRTDPAGAALLGRALARGADAVFSVFARHASGKDADHLREVTEKADPDGTLHDRIHPASGRLLSASPVLKPAAEKDYGEWWCPTCQVAIDGRCVTFEERHDACGTPVRLVPEPAAAPARVVYVHDANNGKPLLSFYATTAESGCVTVAIGTLALTPVAEGSR